jgi:hypothetical protein
VAAVGELDQEYEGRIEFTIVPPEETEKRKDELELYQLGHHGLVILDVEGEPCGALSGHEYGRAEIEAAIATGLPDVAE